MTRSIRSSIAGVTAGAEDITDQIAGLDIVTDENPVVRVKVTGVWREKVYGIPLGIEDDDFAAEARRLFHAEFPGITGAVWRTTMVDGVVLAEEGRAVVRGGATGKA